MYNDLVQYYKQSGDSAAVLQAHSLWINDEEKRLADLFNFIDEFIDSEEYADYLVKKSKIIKKHVHTQYSLSDLKITKKKVKDEDKYPLTLQAKKMEAFIQRFEIYTKNENNAKIIEKQIKGINMIRSKIEEVKKFTSITINNIKRDRERKLDRETKEFCEMFNIDFSKIRSPNKKKFKERVASYSKIVRHRNVTRKENIAVIARTILEEIKRDKKIMARLNKTYDYKVVKHEWIIKDLEVIGTAMGIYKSETHEMPLETVEVVDEIVDSKIEDVDQTDKKKLKKSKNDKSEKSDKKDKTKGKKEKGDKKEKKEKKDKDDAGLVIPIGTIQTQREKITTGEEGLIKLLEQFTTFDDFMEDHRMAKAPSKPEYIYDKHFVCDPQTILFSNYETNKKYKRIFKIQNNSYEPRKFRFVKLITSNDYDTLLFELKPLPSITILRGGASLTMMLVFAPQTDLHDINAELLFYSFDYESQNYRKFSVAVSCITDRSYFLISSNNIHFGKVPIWQTNKLTKHLTLVNDGTKRCVVVIKKCVDQFELLRDESVEDESFMRLNEVEENFLTIKTITKEIVEYVFNNFSFEHTFLKMGPSETKVLKIQMRNIDSARTYIERYQMEVFDFEHNLRLTNEIVVEAEVTGHFITTLPEILDFGKCVTNSVYQIDLQISNSSSSTQALVLKVPSSLKDYVKPDVANIYLASQCFRTVWIRLFLGKSIFRSSYFSEALNLLQFPLQICVLTKNYTDVFPVTVQVFAIITNANLLNITSIDDQISRYNDNCLSLDIGKCSIYETVTADMTLENTGLISEIYGFTDLPPFVTVEPNYGFGEIGPFEQQKITFHVHPDYKDVLKNFSKYNCRNYSLIREIHLTTVTNMKLSDRFFDSKKLRASVQFILKEMATPVNVLLQEDIESCVQSIRDNFSNKLDDTDADLNLTIFLDEPQIKDNENVEAAAVKNDAKKVNVTKLKINTSVIKPLVEVCYQYVRLPDTPCSSYSVISTEIRSLQWEFSEEIECLRKRHMKLPKFEAWFKITGDNEEIRIEPSCGILKNGEIFKLFVIATPSTPDKIIKDTAKSIKYAEVYENKKREFELNIKKDTKKNKDKNKGKKNDAKEKKSKKKDKNAEKSEKSSPDTEITVTDSELVINQEDYYPAEMCYWRTLEPYTISSTLTCIVNYDSEVMERPKEVITMHVSCRVIKPDFISNLKFQRVDFGQVTIGNVGVKEIVIQNITYAPIQPRISLLNPVGPFFIPYAKKYTLSPECYFKIPVEFAPTNENSAEEYIELSSGITILPLVLQGIGVQMNLSFLPEFLVCRLSKATPNTIEECVFKIQNSSDASVTLRFEKAFEIEGVLKPVPTDKPDNKTVKEDRGSNKSKGKEKGSKRSNEKKKEKKDKKFSDDLSATEIFSIPNFRPTKDTSYFDILNLDDDEVNVGAKSSELIKIGFGTKDTLVKTKQQIKDKQKEKKTKEPKKKKGEDKSKKNPSEEKIVHVVNQITMRPMMGMIDSFIIISARFKTFKVSKRLEEEWKLVVDGQEEKAIPIFVRGLADLPSIEIGNENDLILPTAQVDTVVTERFMLKNTSIFNLHFKFELPEHKLVSITPASGDVRLQDVVPIDVIYQAKVCTPNKMDLICKLHVKKKLNTIVGPDFDHKFTIQCDSAYSELCATPIAEEFHVVEYGTVIKTNFNVFNFGLSAVSFVLNDTEGYNSLDNITLIPNSGYIGPGQHMKIDLELECKTMGENDIQISYYPKNTTEPEADTKITQLLRISYMTVLGRLKIIEIVEHNFGPLFAKTHFWEYLQIERLNEQFIEVQPNQVDSVDIYMPECLLGSKHYVTLLVENISLFDTEIILKRKKMCECEIKQQPVSLNTTKLVYNCPHREILVLESTSDRIDKKSTQMITFKVTYSIPEETILAYEIHLRHHRIFILYVHVYGILPDTGRVSAYNPSFSMKLKPVYLATHAPPIQIFWLYNNTEVPAEVELNQLKISEYCNNENYEVIKCSNTRGELKPFSIFALNFQFCPIQYKIYHIEIPIVLNGEEKILNLEGLGAIKNTIHEEYFYFSMPQSSGETDKFPVVFSSDYIIFEGLPIWNCTEKIIFIKNITKTKVMHYEWSCVDIPKTVKISVLEESGYLLPEQSHAVTIQVKSYYVSVIADFILTCQLTDLQQLYAAKQIEAFEKQLVKEKENAMEFQPKKHRKRKIVQTSGNFNESKQIVAEKDSVIFPMSITARVNIIHRKDVTNFIKLSHIFKYSPPETLEINFSSETESLPELSKSTEMHDITEFVLRRVISDVVFGESFKEIIRAMKEETHIYYSQFSSGEQEPLYLNSKERLQTFFSRPSTPVLAETLKKFICDSVLETFQLSTALKDGGGESKKDFTEKNKCDEEQDAATGSNDVIVNKKDAAISRIIEKLAGMCKEDCTCSEK